MSSSGVYLLIVPLIAPVIPAEGDALIKRLQIPVEIAAKSYFIDFLDMATVFGHQIEPKVTVDLGHLRHEIKSSIDFLVEGF